MSTLHMAGRGKPMQFHLSSTSARKARRSVRKHARRMEVAGCPEKAAIWRKRARNG